MLWSVLGRGVIVLGVWLSCSATCLYYAAGPGDFVYYPDLRALVITDTSALSCHRLNGAPVTPFGLLLCYSPNVSELQINTIEFALDPPVVAKVMTVNNDVVCLGEAPAPVVVDPIIVFASGLE